MNRNTATITTFIFTKASIALVLQISWHWPKTSAIEAFVNTNVVIVTVFQFILVLLHHSVRTRSNILGQRADEG